MTELEESVVELLVKKLGVEKEEVEKAHTSFLDKHPEGHMTRLVLQQKTNALKLDGRSFFCSVALSIHSLTTFLRLD